jgi:hypothetical protein
LPLANQARDGLAGVVRKLGTEQPQAQPPAGGPQGQPAQPPKAN